MFRKGIDVLHIRTNYTGIFDCVKSIIRQDGVFGFYHGIGVVILQVFFTASRIVTSTFRLRELLLKA